MSGEKSKAMVLVVFALFLTSAMAPVQAASPIVKNTPTAYDWPMALHDSAHSGNVTSPAPYTNAVLASKALKSAITGSAIAANASIYVSAGATLYSLNVSTLASFWTKAGGPWVGSAASSGGMVFMGTTGGTFYALQGATGTTVWKVTYSSPIVSSPLVVGGKVIFATSNSTLWALNEATGARIWRHTTPGTIKASPSSDGSLVAIGSNDGTMSFVSLSTGAIVRSFHAAGAVQSSANFEGGVAYFGSNDTNVYAVNTATGATVWAPFKTGGAVLDTPLVANGLAVVGSMDGNLYGINLANGKQSWSLATGPIAQSGALAEGTHRNMAPPFKPMVYVATTTGTLYGVNRNTGKTVWTLALSGTKGGGPIIAYTKVYIGDGSGKMYEIGALRFATPASTFTTGGVFSTTFTSSATVRLAANAAWGKYGINRTLVSVFGPKNQVLLNNGTMTFVTGRTGYNLYYDWQIPGLAPGSYKITVLIEDAHGKATSNNPRCCGWVDFKTNFTVTA